MKLNDDKTKFKSTDAVPNNNEQMTDDEKIDLAAAHILKIYRPAFEELAK
jgi:hypothetical protein